MNVPSPEPPADRGADRVRRDRNRIERALPARAGAPAGREVDATP